MLFKFDSVKNGEKNSFKDFVTLKPLMNSRILCETFQNVEFFHAQHAQISCYEVKVCKDMVISDFLKLLTSRPKIEVISQLFFSFLRPSGNTVDDNVHEMAKICAKKPRKRR